MNRRQALCAVGLCGIASSVAKGEETPAAVSFRFGKPVMTATTSLDPKAGATIVTDDGRVIALIFGDPKLGDLQIALGEPENVLAQTKLVTFNASVQAPANRSLIGYRQILQGFVQKGKGSRVVIIADLAGSTKVIEYPFGQATPEGGENFVHSFFSPDVNLLSGTEEVAPLPIYAGTITLLVQTRSPKDQVLAAIDSLDVEAETITAIAPPPKRTPAKRRSKA